MNWSMKISNLIQALAIVTLVAVTWFYAKQTQRLVEESIKDRDEEIKKRNIDFLERTIGLFFEPMIQKLNDMRNLSSISEISAEEFNKVIRDVYYFFNGRRYMISEETASRVLEMYDDFIALVDLDKESKKEFATSESKVRDIIVSEWMKAENRIRAFYGLKGGQNENS